MAGGTAYFNSQGVDGDRCFFNGLNDQNGYAIPDGAVWDIQYVEGKGWTIRNVGTGKYLKTNDAAKYDEPTYFTFCTLKEVTTGIDAVRHTQQPALADQWYMMDGRQLNGRPSKSGLYIHNGRKVVIR